jgi:DNA-binding response OmpR family regulator
MGSATILVVDDERKIRDLVRSYLEREGYSVLVADTGQRALEAGSRTRPDLVVLDLMLPDLSGEEVARSLRTASNVPIIMLTAKAGEEDRVAGLRLGADDYLPKPFSPRELVARVEAVLRRSGGGQNDGRLSFEGGSLVVDRDSREVAAAGARMELTRSEFDLLYALASRPGRVFSRYELINRVQGYDYEGYERTIDAHVKNREQMPAAAQAQCEAMHEQMGQMMGGSGMMGGFGNGLNSGMMGGFGNGLNSGMMGGAAHAYHHPPASARR